MTQAAREHDVLPGDELFAVSDLKSGIEWPLVVLPPGVEYLRVAGFPGAAFR